MIIMGSLRSVVMNYVWVFGGVVMMVVCFAKEDGFAELNVTEVLYGEKNGWSSSKPLMVGLTLIPWAASKGAVCLDGSWPGYHLHRGYGSGANSWIVDLEGGAWCNTIRSCAYRKRTRHGSSNYMEKFIPFTGILSNKRYENPDFYNWNRVKIRYCDGASFSGDSQNEEAQLYFRGQRIFLTAMEELMSHGMRYANQALLSGSSAGGLASILHCDEFRGLFSRRARVKCLSDAGLFLDATDVAGQRTLRKLFAGVVHLQGVGSNLPQSCTSRFNPTMCFFPHRIIPSVKTPLFLVNAAYDSWQLQESLATRAADPHGNWYKCKLNNAHCSTPQIQFLQGFRRQMLRSISVLSKFKKNGYFINSCFAHGQIERQDTWFSPSSPRIGNKLGLTLISSNLHGNGRIISIDYSRIVSSFTAPFPTKGIAGSVGNWFFDRAVTKVIDCPYPCDRTCHNLVFTHL